MPTKHIQRFERSIKVYAHDNTHNHIPILTIAFKLVGSIHLLTANYSRGPNLYGESPK
jgi:hypothetical protein